MLRLVVLSVVLALPSLALAQEPAPAPAPSPELTARVAALEAQVLAMERLLKKQVDQLAERDARIRQLEARLAELDPKQERVKVDPLEEQVEALFARIEECAQERDVEQLVELFTQLRTIMNREGAAGSDVAKRKMKQWSKRLGCLNGVGVSIQLQIYINEGNGHLRAMANARKAGDEKELDRRLELIRDLCEDMEREEAAVFARNAEALRKRGEALAR